MSKLTDWLNQDDDAPEEQVAASEAAPADPAALHDHVVDALRNVYDPEIPVNIYDLGLVYDLQIDDDCRVKVDLTLTAPGCPVAQEFPGWVENAIRQVPGVTGAEVELVWEPQWTPDRMTEAAKLQLGML